MDIKLLALLILIAIPANAGDCGIFPCTKDHLQSGPMYDVPEPYRVPDSPSVYDRLYNEPTPDLYGPYGPQHTRPPFSDQERGNLIPNTEPRYR